MKPTVYKKEKHHILLSQVDPDACYVIQKLRAAGHSAYLVGGGVRDLLLKQKPKDFDISTSARPEEVKALFRNAILIGRRFRLAHVRFGRKIIEVATFRAGDPETTDLILRDNVWGSEEEDVLRRDFTINGLFYDPEQETVIDYVSGFSDLEKGILRTIGTPDVRFLQDPVRMLRLLKFCARFDFEIFPATHEALLNCKENIVKSSPARILEELLRMLESGASAPFFHLLHQYGMLPLLLPEIDPCLRNVAEEELFAILREVDAEIKKEEPSECYRAFLVAAMLFPLCHQALLSFTQGRNRQPHLGQIFHFIGEWIDRIFAPFFHIPRKIHAGATSILASQYRIYSLEKRPPKQPRWPKDPEFPYALHLFKLRAQRDASLWPIHDLWTETAFATHQTKPVRQPALQK